MEAFSCGSSAAHKRDNSDTAITPWWMSCDRHWKLLLGGFRSLVQGLYISKVKSKLCARPILLFHTLFLLWKHCLICTPPPPKRTHTPTSSSSPVHPSLLVWNEPFHLNPNQSQWDQWVVQWRNMAICPSLIPTAPQLISPPLRITHWSNCLCLQATLRLIIWFISEEQELGERQVCVCERLCVCVYIEGCGQTWNTCSWLKTWMVLCCSNMNPFYHLRCFTSAHQHTETRSKLL